MNTYLLLIFLHEEVLIRICFKFCACIGDSLAYSNGHRFTTKDQDNDISDGQCAHYFKGAWWYAACLRSNLNGLYLGGVHATMADGMEWTTWTGFYYSLKSTKMMIRRM